MSLNTQSPIPLYRQLADRILFDIDAGVHAVATRIPSENELAHRYDIGRPTVRQATDMLVRQGRLERRRGSGTFVLPPTRSIDLFSLAGTSAALRKSELDARLELVVGPVREKAIAARDLNSEVRIPQKLTPQNERLRIERRAIVDEIPVLYETLWFNCELFPGLEKQSLENQPISALVRDVYFLEPTSADQTFFVITANAILAERLNTPIGSPLLKVCRELHFGDNRSALHAEIICLTDRFEFSQTLYPARTDQTDEMNGTPPNRNTSVTGKTYT